MPKRKYYYYVGVHTAKGMQFVTSLDNKTKTAIWDENEKPMLFNSESLAQDIAQGLLWNFYSVVLIKSLYEIENHFIAITDE